MSVIMTKLAVLGATGGTGQQVLNLALKQGYEVVALCRNPSGLPIKHEKLKAVQADVFSVDSMKPHFEGCDAVFSCLGRSASYTRLESNFFVETMKAISQAMVEARVRRFVCITAWNTDYKRNDGGPFFNEWILKPYMRLWYGQVLDDMHRMELHLRDSCPDINYTIVKPPGMTDGPLTDNPVVSEESSQYVKSVGWSRNQMSRADIARFMLSTLKSAEYERKVLAITV